MIRSMTGFGRGESEAAEYRFLVEIKSVNHRFLNTNLRLPREFDHHESVLVARCAERCERGHLNVRVEVEPGAGRDARGPRLNREALDRLLEIVASIDGAEGVRGGVSAEGLLALPGVIDWEPPAIALDDAAFLAGARLALDAALEELNQSRATEGRALEADFRARLDSIERWRGRIEGDAPLREQRERERLQEKVRALLGDLDDESEQRIATEIVLLADRVDISEELTRLRAHLDHFAGELDAGQAGVGRKLTFLLQELNREANTIGAKANDSAMQLAAIEIKSELEKMREQAENVE